ncbi:MAG: MOSC domain-containing protein [Planctomycetota bacterium]
MHIISVNIGPRGTLQRGDKTEPSGFDKRPVDGAVHVGTLGIAEDTVVDTRFHGGPQRALLIYPAKHHDAWRQEGWDLPPGGFGENLTVDGVDENDARIGDVLVNGDLVLQVSQPRQPCWKIDARWETKGLTKRAMQTGRNGWYVRVLAEGQVQAGDTFELRERGDERFTVQAVHDAMVGRKDLDPYVRRSLANYEPLNPEWREALA